MKKIFIKHIIVFIILQIITLPFLVGAQSTQNPNPGTQNPSQSTGVISISNPFKAKSVTELLKVLIDEILIPIGSIVAVIMIIYSGFLFVTARGSDAGLKRAKDSLFAAVIGSAILLGAWVIARAIEVTVNQLKV